MKRAIFLAVCLLPSIAGAAQPLSKSMAECAGLLSAMKEFNRQESLDNWLDQAVSIWIPAAEWQAAIEGIDASDTVSYAQTHADAKRDDWVSKGRLVVLSEDFRDWTAYCRKLARAKGIDLPKPPRG